MDAEITLAPNPTNIEYPEGRQVKRITTQDGAVIVQRPLRDSRTRRWIWRGHGAASEPYATQWALLTQLEHRARLLAGVPVTVQIWEDVSGVDGLDRRDGQGNRVFTTVRFVQVNWTPQLGGGPVRYDSVVESVINDTTYQSF